MLMWLMDVDGWFQKQQTYPQPKLSYTKPKKHMVDEVATLGK